MIFLIVEARYCVKNAFIGFNSLFAQRGHGFNQLFVADLAGMNFVIRCLAKRAGLIADAFVLRFFGSFGNEVCGIHELLLDFSFNFGQVFCRDFVCAVFGIAFAVIDLHDHALAAECVCCGNCNAASRCTITFFIIIGDEHGCILVFFVQLCKKLLRKRLLLRNVFAVCNFLHIKNTVSFRALSLIYIIPPPDIMSSEYGAMLRN